LKNCQTFENFFVFITLQNQPSCDNQPAERSLELYTGFYAAGNSKPIFFFTAAGIETPHALASSTTIQLHQQSGYRTPSSVQRSPRL
jgi:hypothetical protein